jgi:hypothetical protein
MFAVERTANIKVNPPLTEKILSALLCEFNIPTYCPKGMYFFTFCPLSRKLKEKSLCVLCASSEAGGEFMSNE